MKFLFAIMLILIGTAFSSSAQRSNPPEIVTERPPDDYSCLKYQVGKLQDASMATDEAGAHLALLKADAYAQLYHLGQTCGG